MVSRFALLLVFLSSPVLAVVREDVVFEVDHGVSFEMAVYVVGDLPELGAGDVTKAIRLVRVEGTTWRVTVSLPVGRKFTYQFLRRRDGDGLCNPGDAVFLGAPITAETRPRVLEPREKLVLFRSSWNGPVLHWRQGVEAFTELDMSMSTDLGQDGTPVWEARFGQADRRVEFFIADRGGAQRDPTTGFHEVRLDRCFVQRGEVFTYIPSESVTPPRHDYATNDIPVLHSQYLGHSRGYRVLLPRGYDEHVSRRYPVVYLHDGGLALNLIADPQGEGVSRLISEGKMREAILVAVDIFTGGGTTRLQSRVRDYVPPGDTVEGVGGQADVYAKFLMEELKPHIDSQYRTLPFAEDTATAGWSLGGVCALYLGWDYPEHFRRVGSWSGSFFIPNFRTRLFREANRDLRVYLDSGEDNYSPNLSLRNVLVGRETGSAYAIEGDLRYKYDCGQTHTPAAASRRTPDLFTFLLPATEAESPADCNQNGVPDIVDLGNGTSQDIDGDAVPDECQSDCDGNGLVDARELREWPKLDCDGNGRLDSCDIAAGDLEDADRDGVPDDCGRRLVLFRRGNCNDDSVVDITDAVFTLGTVFLGEGEPKCDDACDANDDGAIDVSDALTTLGVLFLGEGVIPPPGITICGLDLSDDALSCELPPTGCP